MKAGVRNDVARTCSRRRRYACRCAVGIAADVLAATFRATQTDNFVGSARSTGTGRMRNRGALHAKCGAVVGSDGELLALFSAPCASVRPPVIEAAALNAKTTEALVVDVAVGAVVGLRRRRCSDVVSHYRSSDVRRARTSQPPRPNTGCAGARAPSAAQSRLSASSTAARANSVREGHERRQAGLRRLSTRARWSGLVRRRVEERSASFALAQYGRTTQRRDQTRWLVTDRTARALPYHGIASPETNTITSRLAARGR